MREIKFRVWITHLKEIQRVFNIDSGNYVRTIDNEETGVKRFNDWDKVVLLQFTGLLDRNGKLFSQSINFDSEHQEEGETRTTVNFVCKRIKEEQEITVNNECPYDCENCNPIKQNNKIIRWSCG